MDKFIAESRFPVRTVEAKLTDASCPLLRINWKDLGVDPENPNEYCSLTIDANGSGASGLILFLDIGASASDYTQYQFSAHSAAASDPRGVDASPTHTQVTTLGALITALRAISGIDAYRLHAPADYSLATDDFIDLAVTRLGPLFSEVLYRDASEVLVISRRIGVPYDANGQIGRGNLELLGINAYIDSNSATDCTFKLSYDPSDEDATQEVELAGFTRLVPDATWTDMFDWLHKNPVVLEGPILLEATATTAMAVNAVAQVQYRSFER